MPGTGIKGYSGPALYGGSYNISNGIIQSGSAASKATTPSGYTIVNRNSPYGRDLSGSSSNGVTNAVAQNLVNGQPEDVNVAQAISQLASQSASQYGDLIREMLAMNERNTAQSQAFAREQMDYQSRSDQAAMAWSAQEAQKNRDWQEELSNTAHQREVKDLMAAGLNPVLSANAGAYTGSGATGQGFSSSGAMGQVDTSATGAIGSLLSSMMNTAAQVEIAQMYTDAEKYGHDLSYGASRLASEVSVLNNQNSTSAQKEIAYAGFTNDLEKTRLAGEYGLSNTALSNAGAYDRTVYSENAANGRQMNSDLAANYRTNQTNESNNYRTNQTNASNERQTESKNQSGSWLSAGPYRGIANWIAKTITGNQITYDEAARKFLKNSNGRASSYSPYASKLLKDIGWG